MLIWDALGYLPDILVKVDRASMFYSLKQISFLDHRISEVACRIPNNLVKSNYGNIFLGNYCIIIFHNPC